MALVKASQIIILEGFTELKKRKHWWCRAEYVRTPISYAKFFSVICDDTDAPAIIEQKIQNSMKNTNGWGINFEGWTSYRKYFKPKELKKKFNGGFSSDEFYYDCSSWQLEYYKADKEIELKMEYIRDWRMEKIIKELDGNLFAVLCKELGISGGEAIARG